MPHASCKSHQRTLLAMAAASMLFTAAHAAEPHLFANHVVPSAAARHANTSIQAVSSLQSSRQMQLVDANARAVSPGTERLDFNLQPGRSMQVEKMNAYRNEDGTVVWTGVVGGETSMIDRLRKFGRGEMVEDPQNTPTIVRDGDTLTGSIRVDGQLFSIQPMAGGKHVIVEVDESKLPSDDAHGEALPVIPMQTQASFDTAADSTEPTRIRVGLVFTTYAAQRIASRNAWAQAVIADANDAYSRSGVKIRLVLAGTRVVDYLESRPGGSSGAESYESFSRDLDRFRNPRDGYMDGVHQFRNQNNADVMVLVRRQNDELCGKASGIGSNAATAFAALSMSCGPGRYTFGHELGHLQGARHDVAHDDSTQPKPYAHGTIRTNAPGGRYRTLMSTCWEDQDWCWNTPRVNLVSNPNRSFNGVATGNASRADNHRAMNESRRVIAGFR